MVSKFSHCSVESKKESSNSVIHGTGVHFIIYLQSVQIFCRMHMYFVYILFHDFKEAEISVFYIVKVQEVFLHPFVSKS